MRRKMSISILLGFFILAAGVTTSGTADRASAAGVQANVKSSQARHAPDRVIDHYDHLLPAIRELHPRQPENPSK